MEGRKIERMFRSFGFAGEDSEESVATEYEDSFVRHVADSQLFDYSSASGSSTPHSSRSIDYRTKDLALHRIEEICKSFHAEDASSIESDTSFSLAPRRLNTSCQMSSEYSYDSTQAVFPTNILNISTASASNDHDGTESLSSSFEMVDNFLNKRINDSTSMALDYVDTIGCKNNPHNTWQNHQDSFKFTESASYMAIQAVLHKLRKIPNKKEDCGATAEWNQCFNRLSKSFQTVTNDFKQQLSTILEETQLGDDDNSISVFREIVMKIIGKTCDIQDDIQSLISFVNDYMLPNVSSVRFPSLSAAEVDVKAASPVATNPVNIAKCKKIYRKTPVDLAKGLTFANTPLRIAELTRGIDTPKSNTQCPSGTPGSPGIPMPELIEEQEKLLAECHMKELAVASESSYSLKSVNNCKSTNFDDSNHQSNELSPINSAARGQVSDNFYDSLGDLDIEEKMVERDKQIAETEKTIKGTVDNKKITGSYSDESLNIVNTNFDNSGSRVKSGDGLHDSGVETTSSACRSRRNKFSGSDNSLESRLDNISIPTAASSTSKVDSTKKNNANKFTPAKSVSSSQLSSALSVVADKSSSKPPVLEVPAQPPMILVTPSTSFNAATGQDNPPEEVPVANKKTATEAEEQEGSEDENNSLLGVPHLLTPQFFLNGIWYMVDDVERYRKINWASVIKQVRGVQYTCNFCKKDFKRYQIKEHVWYKEMMGRVTCGKCNFTYYDHRNLHRHYKKCTGQPAKIGRPKKKRKTQK